MHNDLYICHTLHHVMISMIKQLHSGHHGDIVLCSDIPNMESLANSLEEKHLFQRVYCFEETNEMRQPHRNRFAALLCSRSARRRLVGKGLQVDLKKYDDVYIFNDWTVLGIYLMDCGIHYHLIEDGINGFQVLHKYVANLNALLCPPHSLKQKILATLNGGYRFFGQSKWCIDIEVNENKNLDIPNEKVFSVPKKDLFLSLTEQEKSLIYTAFVKTPFPETENKKSMLLLTQPLYKDGLVKTESQQERVYRHIVESYGSDHLLVIKPHPRDGMNYSAVFPNAIILDPLVPIEVMNFNPYVCYDRAVTIESSSIQMLERVKEKIKIGMQILDAV